MAPTDHLPVEFPIIVGFFLVSNISLRTGGPTLSISRHAQKQRERDHYNEKTFHRFHSGFRRTTRNQTNRVTNCNRKAGAVTKE